MLTHGQTSHFHIGMELATHLMTCTGCGSDPGLTIMFLVTGGWILSRMRH